MALQGPHIIFIAIPFRPLGPTALACPDPPTPEDTPLPDSPREMHEPSPQESVIQRMTELEIVHSPLLPYRPAGERDGLVGQFAKNLLVRDKAGIFFLLICNETTRLALPNLRRTLRATRCLSFATSEELWDTLSVKPGAVTPFALMFLDPSVHQLRIAVDNEITKEPSSLWNFHPMNGELTTAITADHLLHFVRACGFNPEIVSMT
eukprot:TRINITY_DN4199_c0_g1_i1.p1 TRINITY_DN4199_c0_g1~~TRINITY_DN4199_c0_g1_i1.p1  ORF type:complete len:207 (+),score=31.95 TRINITY_DN4199_c0_g1_i1:232-852(+)